MAVWVAVGVLLGVDVLVGVAVPVDVLVGRGVFVGVSVGGGVGVWVGLGVGVGAGVNVGVGSGVGVIINAAITLLVCPKAPDNSTRAVISRISASCSINCSVRAATLPGISGSSSVSSLTCACSRSLL